MGLNQGGKPSAMAIQALIIQPDSDYEVREVEKDLRTFQEIVGGFIEDVPNDVCVLWCDEDGKSKRYPTNTLATYLWWKLEPEQEGRDVLRGTVLVTGKAEGDEPLPVPDEVVDLLKHIHRINLDSPSRYADDGPLYPQE